jgi:hypothetical protein
MRIAAMDFSRCEKVSMRRPQRHEDPEDDDADRRHQDQIAEGFHWCSQFFHGVERIFAKREPLFSRRCRV